MQEIAEEAKETQSKLIERGLIKEVSPDHIERWHEKIMKLREDKSRLERLFTGYEDHILPYDIDNRSDVDELFASLLETVEMSRNTRNVMAKVCEAYEKHSLESIKLIKEDKISIHKMMNVK